MGVVPQLDFSLYPSQAFWFVCAFLLLYAVVRAIVVPRVEDEVRSRLVSREGAVSASTAAASLIEGILKKQLDLLDSTQRLAEDMVRAEMEKLREACDTGGALLEDEVSAMLQAVDSKLDEMKKRELEDVVALAAEMAVLYYSKITGAKKKTTVGKLKKIVAGLYEEKL